MRDLVEWKGTTMDVTEQAQARIELERAFEESKRLRDQLHDENVVRREQIDQAFMFEEIVVTSSAFQGALSRLMKVAPTDSSVLVNGTSHSECQIRPRKRHRSVEMSSVGAQHTAE